MSEKNTPEDLESTIRLETSIIEDPYDKDAPASIDNIEDLFNTGEFSGIPDVSFELPEEANISTQESINFDDLTKEMNELSNEFELNIPEEVKEEVQVAIIEDKPIEKKATEKISNTTTKKPAPQTSAPTAKQDTISDPDTPPTDKKEVKKTKEPTPKTNAKKTKQDTTSNPDTPPTDKKEVKKTKEPASVSTTKKITTNTSKSSNGITTAMLCISLIALVAGFTGAWTSMSSQSQIDTLSAQLNAVQSNRLNNQPEISAIQKQLTSLKQELANLKIKHETPSLIKNETAKIIKPVKKLSPAVITPITPIKEVKPTLLKSTWNVIISSHNSMKKAKSEQQRETMKGMKTSIVAVTVKGKSWYRIVATGFTDKQQAITFTHKLKQQGISDAWVQYNK